MVVGGEQVVEQFMLDRNTCPEAGGNVSKVEQLGLYQGIPRDIPAKTETGQGRPSKCQQHKNNKPHLCIIFLAGVNFVL